MKRRLLDETGVTMVELLVVIPLVAMLMLPIVLIMVSGMRGGADSNARLDAQQNSRLALDRIEYEGRCATAAALVDDGEGVYFSLPLTCSHATGDVTWCVVDGTLTRYTANSCTGDGQAFVSGITTATPFSMPVTASGDLPQLDIAMRVDTSNDPGTATAVTDAITLRNAPRAS